MAKLYSKNSPEKVESKNPRKETVKFLLNYSKALKVTAYKKLKFDAFLN